MSTPSPLKPLTPPSHAFSMRAPPPSPSSPPLPSTAVKFKTLIHNSIFRHLRRLTRVAKSLLRHLLRRTNTHFLLKKNKTKNNLYFGSFRLHYNWCSSHGVVPIGGGHVYYDSTWNSFVDSGDVVAPPPESQLSGYLHWLENKGNVVVGADEMNEIDRLADMFIANCHEKFRLEKQESNRRFQEMMARSV